MKSGEKLVLPFRAIVTQPGIYHFNCLRFQIGRVATTEDAESIKLSLPEETPSPPPFDEDELIPLKLSFVIHESNAKA